MSESPRPRRPAPAPRPPRRQSVVNWPVVYAAGGVAWLGVLGLVGLAVFLNPSPPPTEIVIVQQPPEPAPPAPGIESPPPTPAVPGPEILPEPRTVVFEEPPPALLPTGLLPAAAVLRADLPHVPDAEVASAVPLLPPWQGPPKPDVEFPAEPQTLPASEMPPGKATVCEKFGTRVDFAPGPAEAARTALKERKLLFVVHIAGNFEDSGFT